MRAGSNQVESSYLQAYGESFNVVNSELDLNFPVGGHAASIKKEAARCRQAPRAENVPIPAAEKTLFLGSGKKRNLFINFLFNQQLTKKIEGSV